MKKTKKSPPTRKKTEKPRKTIARSAKAKAAKRPKTKRAAAAHDHEPKVVTKVTPPQAARKKSATLHSKSRKVTLRIPRSPRNTSHSLTSIEVAQWRWMAGVTAGILAVAIGLWAAYTPPRPPSPAVLTHTAPTHEEPARAIASQAQPKPVQASAPAQPQTRSAPPAQPPASAPAPAPAQAAAPAQKQVSQAQTSPASTAAAAAAQDGVLQAGFEKVAKYPIAERVAYWTNLFWKSEKPHEELEVLGKQVKIPDSAPLVPQKFDCTTFVETIAALSRSRSQGEFAKNLFAIRYKDGEPSFATRNHFPEIDWIPNNTKAGILRDITKTVGLLSGTEVATETKVFDKKAWLAKQENAGKISRSIASVSGSDWDAPVRASVPYLPIEKVDQFIQKIPQGAILNLVRKNNEGHPVLISHQGFVVREGNTVLLRHVSQSGNVRTVHLSQYLRRLQEEGASTDWPLLGVNFNQLNEIR